MAEVSRQAFHDWQAAEAAGPNEAELAEALLVEAIRAIHDQFDGTYGEPRITEELARRGWKVNHKRIERLMRLHGIAGVHKPARVRTTIPAEDAPPLPDLIGRRFDPGRPDVAWVGDIERHEALPNLAVVKGHRRVLVAAGALKLRAA
ncbi:MAG TPA: IS3 family transposase [Acidimicrobiales bacterium]|nr:IS3 family transposase [Acidimicrobiales bacterium]